MIPSIRFSHLAELRREMDRLSRAAQGRIGRNATMAAARLAARYAREQVPVRTGALKRSIKARRGKNPQLRGQAVAFVNARSPIAHLVEHGTVHSAPRPYLRPAIDEHQPELRAKMAEIIANGLRRELAKLGQLPEDPGEL